MLLVLCLCVGLLAYIAGYRRALAMDGAGLHSLPFYHGMWLAMLAAGPCLILLAVWSVLIPILEKNQVMASIAGLTAGLPPPQLEALWRDIVAQAADPASGASDVVRTAGTQAYIRLSYLHSVVLYGLLTVVAGAGFYLGSLQLTPAFRARQAVERVFLVLLMACSGVAVLTTLGIILSLIAESLRFFASVPLLDFLTGLSWTPQQMAFRADQAGGTAAFGFVPLLTGTLLITVIALLVSAPLGLLSAIYLSFYAPPALRAIGKPVLEILAGIPTVVYGFFAALTVAPALRSLGTHLGLDVSSESALAAGLVMGIMIVPFISSLSDDVITAVPQSLRDGSTGLGATTSETILRVILPAALPGIVSSLILAVSRAIGETMIVVMAAGLAANLTLNPLQAVTTITVQIGTLLTGDQEFDSPKTLAAFALGLVLFVITLILNIIALKIVNRYRQQYD